MNVAYPFAVSIDVLLARHGIRPPHVTVADIGPREPRGCHRNAGALVEADDRYTWWTGRAMQHAGYDWVQHSWIADGVQHLEITWDAPGIAYFGIPIPPRLARAARQWHLEQGPR